MAEELGTCVSKPGAALPSGLPNDLDSRGFYDGQWLKNTESRQGVGYLTRENKEIYHGYFLSDLFHFKGKFTFKEGDPSDRK